ncbi:Nn.00g019220.m01.CDS01 [Neocucurbitaria sp. VM-36]
MDNHKTSLGRSASMPSFDQIQQSSEKRRQNEWGFVYESSQRALQSSAGFQDLRDNTESSRVPNRTQSSDPMMPSEGSQNCHNGGSFGNNPLSDTMLKPETSYESDKSSHALTPSSPDSEATVVPDTTSEDGMGIIPIALDRSLADTTAFNYATQHQALPDMHRLAAPWHPGIPALATMGHSRASSGAGTAITFVSDYSQTQSVGSEDSNGCMSPTPDRPPNPTPPRTPTVTNRARLLQDLHVPGQTLHHRRKSSRISSLPAIPSPLGLGHSRKNDLGSDVSGLVSPLPSSSCLPGTMGYGELPRGPMLSGHHASEPSATGKDSTFLRANTGFVHSRKHTDPFIDEAANKWSKSPAPSPRVVPPPKRFSWASPSSAGTPITPTLDSFTPQAAQPSFPHLTPAFQSFFAPTTQAEPLTIPPPALSCIQGLYNPPPEARARLDAQKAIRENWIRTEAKKIVSLKQVEVAAAVKYQQTGSQAEYEAWQRAATAFSDATNTEKRIEERRNLFLPKGMKAMRTEAGNAVADGLVASSAVNGGRVLGAQMALMERVCAEVRRRDEVEEEEDVDEGEITSEMLGTLSVEEKKELRDHLVGRLGRGRKE